MKEKLTIYLLEGEEEDMTLYLDDPRQEPNYPKLSEYLTDKGCDLNSEESLWNFIEYQGSYETEEIREHKSNGTNPAELIGDLNEPLSEGSDERQDWLDWNYDHDERNPAVQAWHFLAKLGACDHVEGLLFYEGDRPGSTMTYVTASNRAVVDQLIAFLGEKGYETNITKFSW